MLPLFMNMNETELAAYIRNEMRNDRSFLVEALNAKGTVRRCGLMRALSLRITKARYATKAPC